MKRRKLHLFTATFPFGWGESYLESELAFIHRNFDKVILHPLSKQNGNIRSLPDNCSVIEPGIPDSGISLKNEMYMFRIIWNESLRSGKFLAYVFKWRTMRAILKRSLALAGELSKTPLEREDAYYSFWMNEWALALAILKDKKRINSFFFRVNGYDIYDERSEYGYLPFRQFIFRRSSSVFTVSDQARKYLVEKYGFVQKIKTAHFGTDDFGFFMPGEGQELRILSCSRLIPLKNCIQIARVIAAADFPVHWHHHGDGPELEKIKEMTNKFPAQIRFTNSAFTDDHQEAMKIQMNFKPDIFISLSKSEGLPVTIINAISMGVPVISTDVGGCAEIVNEETGILLKSAPGDKEVLHALNQMKISCRDENRRKRIRSYWSEHFSSSVRYPDFGQKIELL